MATILANHREAIAKLSHKYSVQRLFAFGSAIKDDSRSRESDVDLLVGFASIGGRVKLHAFLRCLMSRRERLHQGRSRYEQVCAHCMRIAIMARGIEKTKR
jgi:predicted nucleotidyltransferase